jgi:hypothetical protein
MLTTLAFVSIRHKPTFAGHSTWNHRRAPGQTAGIRSADRSASQPLARVESTGFTLLFIRTTFFWGGKIRIALFWILLKFGLRNTTGLRK